MNFMLDSINLDDIGFAHKHFAICGVTSNPSIIKKEGNVDLVTHLNAIREIIGTERSLHVQAVGDTAEEMVKEAQRICSKVDREVYIKIPATTEGFLAMKELHRQGIHVTATVVYTQLQAMMAAACHAEYIAPYYNRMEAMGMEAEHVIGGIRQVFDRNHCHSRILAASFKNPFQVEKAICAGAHCVTVQPQMLKEVFEAVYIKKAVEDFKSDWASLYGEKLVGESLPERIVGPV